MKRSVFALALLGLVSAPAWAAGPSCSATVEANDAMQYNTHALSIPKACKQFTLTLKHTGQLPKAAMGHNLVVSSAADEAGILADGGQAGLAKDYLKPGDPRVLASTPIIGGGQTATTVLKASQLKAGQDYVFFCSFPGHASMMKGTVQVAP